jgi:hypothetical protein
MNKVLNRKNKERQNVTKGNSSRECNRSPKPSLSRHLSLSTKPNKQAPKVKEKLRRHVSR